MHSTLEALSLDLLRTRLSAVEGLRGPAPRSYKGDGEIGKPCTVEIAPERSTAASPPRLAFVGALCRRSSFADKH